VRFAWASAFCLLLSALSLAWVLVVISPQTYRPLMLLLGVWATFRAFPAGGRWGLAIDTAWVAAALLGLGWPLAGGEAFLYRSASPTGGDVLCGVLAMAVVLEAARRTTGWILPAVAIGFLVYAFAGPALGSVGLGGIAHRGYDLPRLIGNLYMTLEGIYGVPLDVAVTYIILFSIYGAVLEASGAGRFFLDFSMQLSSRGNPARAAGRSVTLAGFLLGTVSGSGVATTVTLGSVAWPILKRVGYAADTAGAMLAAAGIGALLSPPTLGAAAFLIAEYLRISYLQVLVMATIPTLLYYLSILIMIEGSAAGRSMSSVTSVGSASSAVPWRSYFHFTSLVLVAVLMVTGFTPFRAVYWATLAAVAMSWMGMPEDRLGPRRIVDALAAGGRDVLPVLATTAVAGIIVGVVTLTGLGLKAAGLIVDLAGASLPLTVFFAALAVWVLGLAVPVTASYIIAAVMVVPALTQVGVPLVAAHMFIFYYAVLSEVSPPTALAPFAAAALTGGRPFRTMMLTWKFALPAFLVPFAFALAPRGLGLLLQTDAMTAVETTLFACIGVFLLATALAENMERGGFTPAGSIAMAASGLLLLYPSRTVNLIGLAAGAISFALHRRPDASRAL
jgi:TRAP transporter 4TM/12TM fusion protein